MNPSDRQKLTMKSDYDKQIEEVFDLYEKLDQQPRNVKLKKHLKQAQKEARRIDGLRNKMTK